MTKPIELLAPAGHIESFFAALENGADAVYLGLKQLSARAQATNFTLQELSLLIPYAHKYQQKVHVTLNSLITAVQVDETLDILQALSDLKADALIVQDPAVFYLARHYFPNLRLHASTLMTIHNHAGVNQLERLGAKRVVLARELSLQEIKKIADKSRIELEVFVHGALCYSYSGLCMASSFRGGQSGLQGRCVQPCRLRFRQGRKEGFFLSCNDLCALPLLPHLKRMRLAAFKIEGRMKSADYIGKVVRAYRSVLDAPLERESEAVAQAQEWLAQAPARRLTAGFLTGSGSEEVLTPHRSGSSGLWIGTVKAIDRLQLTVGLRHDLQPGDRLRPESMEGKEKSAFTITELFSSDQEPLTIAKAGTIVIIPAKGKFQPGERLFRVGTKVSSKGKGWLEIRREIGGRGQKANRETGGGVRFRAKFPHSSKVWEEWPSQKLKRPTTETLIVKIDRTSDLTAAFQSPANQVFLTASRANLEKLARRRLIPAQKSRLVWSIPPLISEKELDYYRPAIDWYRSKGFRTWEVNNWGQFELFPDAGRMRLIAGYRFNLRNPAALAAMAEAGCQWSVMSLEITNEEARIIGRGPTATLPIITVYAWPPLFSSRLIPKLLEGKAFTTPRREHYFYRKRSEYAFIYADRPVNWMEKIPTLRSYGFRHFMLDLSDGPHDQAHNFEQLLSGFKRLRADQPYDLFNFDRPPVAKSKPERGK
ncbi:MAG: peptidase U32 family protein [Desulforhabdus sp.]|nr:peptidase U32 family protein [Desulforhabdus sp.]